jgi:hypothetical protein
MKTPSSRNSQGEYHANCRWFHHGTEGVPIINVVLLREAASNKTSFILVNGAIRMVFGLEDPLVADQVDITRPRHQSPGAGLTESRELSRHGIMPCRFAKSLSMREGSSKECSPSSVVENGAVCVLLLVTSSIMKAGGHAVTRGAAAEGASSAGYYTPATGETTTTGCCTHVAGSVGDETAGAATAGKRGAIGCRDAPVGKTAAAAGAAAEAASRAGEGDASSMSSGATPCPCTSFSNVTCSGTYKTGETTGKETTIVR